MSLLLLGNCFADPGVPDACRVGLEGVVSGNWIRTEGPDFQTVGRGERGRFLIVFHVFGRSDAANGQEEIDGGGLTAFLDAKGDFVILYDGKG